MLTKTKLGQEENILSVMHYFNAEPVSSLSQCVSQESCLQNLSMYKYAEGRKM